MGNAALKYQNLSAFEKHLEQASKVHLSRVFLVVSPCPYERKKIIEKIIAAIRIRQRDLSLCTEDAAQCSLEEKIDGLNTASLFTGEQVLYLDAIDKLKKNELALLAEYAAHPSPFAYLFLGAGASKYLNDLYARGKKELIVCDLSSEKPWDRKDRLKRFLIEKAFHAGKRLQADAAEYLLENVGLNFPFLEQEIEKLITYAGELRELTLQDVQTLCTAQKGATLWQLAEAVVWKENLLKTEEMIDLSLLLPFLSQLRTQLQHGLLLSVLAGRGAAQSEIVHYLPTIKPAALDKMLPIAKRRKSIFFKRALDILFDIELIVKNSSFEPALIFDLILAKLSFQKRHHSGHKQSHESGI